MCTYICIYRQTISRKLVDSSISWSFVASSFARAHIGKAWSVGAWKIGGSFLARIVPLLEHPKHFRPTTFIAINNVTSNLPSAPQGTNLPTFHN